MTGIAPAVLLVEIVAILAVLGGVNTLVLGLSFRINHVAPPRAGRLAAAAFVETLAAGIGVLLLQQFKAEPWTALAALAGLPILAGIPVTKLVLRRGWRETLRLWGCASAIQFVVFPVCGMLLAVGGAALAMKIFPPQY